MYVITESTALAVLNQLQPSDKERVNRAIERLATNWDAIAPSHVQKMERLVSSDGKPLFSYRAFKDFRVFLYKNENEIRVVDVIRRSQLESLRSLPGARREGI